MSNYSTVIVCSVHLIIYYRDTLESICFFISSLVPLTTNCMIFYTFLNFTAVKIYILRIRKQWWMIKMLSSTKRIYWMGKTTNIYIHLKEVYLSLINTIDPHFCFSLRYFISLMSLNETSIYPDQDYRIGCLILLLIFTAYFFHHISLAAIITHYWILIYKI